jgi:hypothetical protein
MNRMNKIMVNPSNHENLLWFLVIIPTTAKKYCRIEIDESVVDIKK